MWNKICCQVTKQYGSREEAWVQCMSAQAPQLHVPTPQVPSLIKSEQILKHLQNESTNIWNHIKMLSKESKTQTVPFASIHCLKIIESFSIPTCFKLSYDWKWLTQIETNLDQKRSASILVIFPFHTFQFHSFTFIFTFIFSRRKYALFPSESLRLRTRCNHTRRTLATSYLTNQAFLCAFGRQNSLNWTMEFKDTTINKPHTTRNIFKLSNFA